MAKLSINKEKTEWNGISLADEFYEQKENRLYTILAKTVIVYLLTMGLAGCILSCVGISYYKPVLYLVVLAESLFCASLYYRKLWENIGYILILFIVLILGITYPNVIRSGVYAVLNDLSETAAGFFNTNAMKSYGEYVSNRDYAVTFSMCYIAGVFCVLVNICISRRMKYIFITVMASCFIAFPLFLNLEPDIIPSIMFISGVIASMAFKRGNHYEVTDKDNAYRYSRRRGFTYALSWKIMMQLLAVVIVCVTVIVIMLEALMPKSEFHETHPDSTLKEKTLNTVQNFYMMGIAAFFNYYPNTGGLTSGRLGGVNSIRLDYNTDLTLKLVPYNTERIYLKSFTGSEYAPYDNRWVRYDSADLENNNAKAYAKAYKNHKKNTAEAVMKVENVDAATGVYLPYYSLDKDKAIFSGRRQNYTFYPQLEGNNVKVPDGGYSKLDDFLSIPEQNRETINAFCSEAGLSTVKSLKRKDVEEAVTKLSNYFQDNIPYTYQPGATPRDKDFINYFLSENKRGYCAHFASAATLILRNLGIPAVYVEGYAVDPSEIEEEGEVLSSEDTKKYYKGDSDIENSAVVSVNVTDADAHAWVEVYEEGRGWQVIEVTPYSDEEPDTNGLLNMLMRFIGGGNSAGDAVNQTDDTKKEVIKDTTKNISISVIAAVIATLIIVICFSRIIKYVSYFVRYISGSINEKIIIRYNRYIQKIGHRNKGIKECINFREQVEWLVSHDIISLSDEEKSRMISILEQAGFSDRQIEGDDMEWVIKECLRRKFFSMQR
ncbi:MAG: transglutaminase-like domain-containing protein [Lachnospiraceae bacterium]|nr:transglutaminase-like domain-containing protein [Lachnospiraceae bacterium]